jgi:two-component system sensor kinase FixL
MQEGLSISKSIIKAHSGRIWAENNNKDGYGGTTFSFSLPITQYYHIVSNNQ